MNRKTIFIEKWVSVLLVLLLAFTVLFAACGDKKELTYSGGVLAEGQVGVAYSQSIAKATGEGSPTVTYSIKTGSILPDGFSLSGGSISGTPTAAANAAKFTVVAKADGFSDTEAEFTITVKGTLAFSGSTLTVAAVGEAYSHTVTAMGVGNPAITYAFKSGSTPPAWLSISAAGVLSGTPAAIASAFSFTVVAKADGFADAEAEFALAVGAGTLVFSGTTLSSAVIGEAYSHTVTATGAGTPAIAYAFKPGSAPPSWLSISAAGVLSGTPTAVASAFSFTVVASADNYASADAVFSMSVINEDEISYQGSVLPTAIVDESYSQSVKTASAKGNPTITYTLTIGTLPKGLSFDNGNITGTPEEETTAPVTLTVTASATNFTSVSAEFTISVDEPEAPAGQEFIFFAQNVDLEGLVGGSRFYGGIWHDVELLVYFEEGKPNENEEVAVGNYSDWILQATHRHNTVVTWKIYSPVATTAQLEFSLATDLTGTWDFAEGGHKIYVNDPYASGGKHGDFWHLRDNALTHSPIVASRTETGPLEFKRYLVGEISLNAGWNEIALSFEGENDWLNKAPNAIENGNGEGTTGGFAVDAMILTTTAGLTWEPCYYI